MVFHKYLGLVTSCSRWNNVNLVWTRDELMWELRAWSNYGLADALPTSVWCFVTSTVSQFKTFMISILSKRYKVVTKYQCEPDFKHRQNGTAADLSAVRCDIKNKTHYACEIQ